MSWIFFLSCLPAIARETRATLVVLMIHVIIFVVRSFFAPSFFVFSVGVHKVWRIYKERERDGTTKRKKIRFSKQEWMGGVFCIFSDDGGAASPPPQTTNNRSDLVCVPSIIHSRSLSSTVVRTYIDKSRRVL
jgi:hypothetical protein